MRSPRYTASSMSWVTTSTVRPVRLHTSSSRSSRSARVWASTEGERLVEQHDLGLVGEPPGAIAARCCMPQAPVPPRRLRGRRGRAPRWPGPRARCAPCDRPSAAAPRCRGCSSTAAGTGTAVLEHQRHRPRRRGDDPLAQADCARRRRHRARHAPQQGGLAASRRPHVQHLARSGGGRDLVDGGEGLVAPAVGLGHAVDLGMVIARSPSGPPGARPGAGRGRPRPPGGAAARWWSSSRPRAPWCRRMIQPSATRKPRFDEADDADDDDAGVGAGHVEAALGAEHLEPQPLVLPCISLITAGISATDSAVRMPTAILRLAAGRITCVIRMRQPSPKLRAMSSVCLVEAPPRRSCSGAPATPSRGRSRDLRHVAEAGEGEGQQEGRRYRPDELGDRLARLPHQAPAR